MDNFAFSPQFRPAKPGQQGGTGNSKGITMNKNTLSGVTRIPASLGVLLVIIFGVSASAAGLGNTEQFEMKMEMVGNMGEMQGQKISMTFYVGKNRLRAEMGAEEMEGMPGGIAFISIFDGDEVTTYTLMSAMKQYMKRVGTIDDYMDEGPGLVFGSPDDPRHPCQTDADMSCEELGSDTFLGRSVDKFLVKDIEDGVPTETIMWFDRELLLPLKTEDKDGGMEATSIKLGAQPDELFELPSSYTEMKMPQY